MKWIDVLNQLIDYLEMHLDEEISPHEIELITGCPYSVFQRMFSYTSDISLHEYIRRRRLSEAAYELQSLQAKVIDVAMKYGYESSDAFCVAFKKQHGVTPAMAKRKNTSLNSYPRLQFRMNIIGGTAMKYRVVQKDSMNVIGVFGSVNDGIWPQVKSDGTLKELEAYGGDSVSLGLCFGFDDDGKNKYMVAVEDKGDNNLKDRYRSFAIPASSWLIFEAIGPLFPTLQNTWKKIYGEFIPSNNYKQNPDLPTVEKYFSNETEAADYIVEIWIPIM